LIVIARWHFDKKQLLSNAHDCNKCKTDSDKIRRRKRKAGCHKVFKRKVIRKIDCVCGGIPSCELCKGENMIKIYTCPRNILIEPGLGYIFPYFCDYISSNCQVWPTTTRLYAPLLLQQAFDVLLSVYNQELKKSIPAPEGK